MPRLQHRRRSADARRPDRDVCASQRKYGSGRIHIERRDERCWRTHRRRRHISRHHGTPIDRTDEERVRVDGQS